MLFRYTKMEMLFQFHKGTIKTIRTLHIEILMPVSIP